MICYGLGIFFSHNLEYKRIISPDVKEYDLGEYCDTADIILGSDLIFYISPYLLRAC